jgi:hypothetical protein
MAEHPSTRNVLILRHLSLQQQRSSVIPKLMISAATMRHVLLGWLALACGDAQPKPDVDARPPTEEGPSLGGESSEFGGNIPGGCPCALQNPLRATITELHEEAVSLRVEEFFGASGDLEVGSEIEGTYGGELPCVLGRAAVVAGDEVLAFYYPPFACPSPHGCELGPVIPGRITLTAWGDTMVLADGSRGEIAVSVEELALLDAPTEECRAVLGDSGDVIGPEDNTP